MKKILAILLLSSIAIPAMAQHHGHHGHHGHRGGHWGWAPFIGGALAGAVIYDIYNRPVVVQQPPVIVQQTLPPVFVQQQRQNCSPWTETQNPDGSITRTRTCAQ